MNVQQLKDWSARTRSDINPIKYELEQGNYETAKALIGDVLQNFDELDKLLADDPVSDLVAQSHKPSKSPANPPSDPKRKANT